MYSVLIQGVFLSICCVPGIVSEAEVTLLPKADKSWQSDVGRQTKANNKDFRPCYTEGWVITSKVTIQGCLLKRGHLNRCPWMTKGLSWEYLWAEGIPTQDPKLGMSLASLQEGKEAWGTLSKEGATWSAWRQGARLWRAWEILVDGKPS